MRDRGMLFLIVVALVIAAAPLLLAGEGAEELGNDANTSYSDTYFKYELNESDMTAKVTGVTDAGKAATTLTVPGKVNDDAYDVVAIDGSSFSSCKSLQTLTIENAGCKAIDLGSKIMGYDGSKSLANVEFKGDVGVINIEAFVKCSALAEVKVCGQVTKIDTSAFAGTTISSLEAGSIDSIGGYVFDGCGSLTKIKVEGNIGSIGTYAFKNCDKLGSIEVYGKIGFIAKNVFYGCNAISDITVTGDVTEIGESAFYKCKVLGSINISGSISEICASAFSKCNGLGRIEIGGDVGTIGYNAFKDCKIEGGFDIEIGGNVGIIGKAAFASTTVKNVKIGGNVTSIGSGPFANCKKLASFDVGGTIGNIGYCAFANSSISSIKFDGVKTIGESAFSYCSNLVSVKLDGITSIETRAFYNCDNLLGMEFGDLSNIKSSLPDLVFSYCKDDDRDLENVVSIDDENVTFTFSNGDENVVFTFANGNKRTFTQEYISEFEKEVFIIDDPVNHTFKQYNGSSVVAYFELGFGIGKVSPIYCQSGEKIMIPYCTGYLEGYAFGGWYYNGTVYQPGEKFTMSSHNVNFTAMWVQYTIKFDSQGGTGVASLKTGTDGKLSHLPTTTKDGYEFNGWYTSDGKRVSTSTQFTMDTTVHAKWNYNPEPEPVVPEENDKTVVVAAIAAVCAAACAAFAMVAFFRRD